VKHFDEQLENYSYLIHKYHKTLDLISNKGLEALEDKISDAKQYAKYIKKLDNVDEILDLGSGIGLPAVVMAILLPEINIHLVERRQRRVAFLKIVASQLELENCVIHSDDVRTLSQPKINIITAQAVATFKDVYELTKSLHKEKITLISRKGIDWASEMASLKQSYYTKVSVQETKGLTSHGSLVAVSLSGGLRCLP